MNNTDIANTRENAHLFYSNNSFPKGTEFEVFITEGMNGKRISQPQTVYTLDAARAVIWEWIGNSTLHEVAERWQPIYFYNDRIVINFGSWVAWGLIKITYPIIKGE